MRDWFLPLLFGFGTGILSAWGVGGGTLLLLCMTLLLDVEPAVARGVNLLYFLPVAAISLLIHGKNGYLDRPLIRQAAPWGMVAALLAALLSVCWDPDVLRRPFGLLLLWAAGSLLWPQKKR